MPHIARPTPEVVAHFADSVRARLSDLSSEQRDELAADLEANLTDLVDEQGPASLSDPTIYLLAVGFAPITISSFTTSAEVVRWYGL